MRLLCWKMFHVEFSIFGLEIGLRSKALRGVGLPVRHSTPDRLGLHSRVRAHLKEEELLYPVTGRFFQISIQIFS